MKEDDDGPHRAVRPADRDMAKAAAVDGKRQVGLGGLRIERNVPGVDLQPLDDVATDEIAVPVILDDAKVAALFGPDEAG